MPNEIASTWYYPFVQVSQDKRVPLPGVREGYAAELAGFDGQLEGGLRPFSGFQKIYDLDCTGNSYHSINSQILDFFPITFNIDFDTYGYGFVYRAQRQQQASTATWTFNAQCPANDTIKLIGNDGSTTTRLYKSTTGGSNGDNVAAVASNATFTFNAAGQVGGTLTLTDTAGTVKTYIGSSEAADSTGDVDSSGNIVYRVGSDHIDSATELRNAIDSSNGHNGTISAVHTGGTGKITLAQSVAGLAGNTTITHSSDPDFDASFSIPPPAAFASGVDASVAFLQGANKNDSATNLAAAINHSNGHSGVMTASSSTGLVTVSQVNKGSSGDTAITVTSGFSSACSVVPPSTFTGGADTTQADIFLDFFLEQCEVWSRGNLIKANVSTTEPMDVESCGRLVVVAVSGSSPILFFISDSIAGTETSTSHALVCPQGGDCSSSSDGHNYCPSRATLTYSTAEQIAGVGAVKAEASWSFVRQAKVGGYISLTSTDGVLRNYKGKDGATDGDTELIGGINYVLFNSGATPSTAGPFTFSNYMTAAETIKLIDTNRVERTYESHISASGYTSAYASTATFTFDFPAVVGSTIALTDITAVIAKTVTYKCSSTYSNGWDAGDGYIYFQPGSDANTSATNLKAAVEHANGHNAAITVACPGSGVVNLTQATAGDGNTLITTGGSFESSCSVNPPTSFTAGGKVVRFVHGGDANATASTLSSAINSVDGHNGTILPEYTTPTPTITLEQTVYDGDNGNTTITVSSGWNARCSVNPPAAFTSGGTDTIEAASAAVHFKQAVDSANGHNATSGQAKLDFTFSGAATVGGTLLLESSVGTNKTLTYKGATNGSVTNGALSGTDVQFNVGTDATTAATNLKEAINSANGHNAKDAKATATFTLFEQPTSGGGITLVSTDGTSKSYVWSNGGTTGDVDGLGNILVRWTSGWNYKNAGAELIDAINSSNGHNGKILTTSSRDTGSGYYILLTQQTGGASGNSTISTGGSAPISHHCNPAPPATFTGGTIAWDGTSTNANHRLELTINVDSSDGSTSAGRFLIEQREESSDGNTTATTGGSFDSSVSGSVASAFSGGGSGVVDANARFVVTANTTNGQVKLQQSIAGVGGDRPITIAGDFAENTNPNPPSSFTGGGSVEAASYFTIINTDQVPYTFIYDRTVTTQDGSQDTDGRYIIGIKDATSIQDQVSATRFVVDETKNETNISAYEISGKKLGLKQMVGGTAGNTSISLSSGAAKIITASNFAGGIGPQVADDETSEDSVSCLNQHTLVIEEDPGPGPRPTLTGPTAGWQDVFEVAPPADTSTPGNGTLFLSTTAPNSGIYKGTGEPLYDPGYSLTSVIYAGGTNEEIVNTWNTANPNDVIDCDGDYGGPGGDGDDDAAGDDPNCEMDLDEFIHYIGGAPGGKPDPNQDGITKKSICNFKLNTITDGNNVNQLPILEVFTFVKKSLPIEQLRMEVYFRKKNDSQNPHVNGSGQPDGYGMWQPVFSGVHAKNITDKSDNMFSFQSNSLGGKYASYIANTGRDVKVAIEEKEALADAADFEGNNTCYVAWLNMSEAFECDNFSPGTYQFKLDWRTMCCTPVKTKSSPTFTFEVRSNLCNFTDEETEVDQVKDLTRLERGNYVFAYVLYDSKTGRRSALSDILQVKSTDFTSEQNYAFLDLVYDKTKYDHAYFYRSVNTLEVGGVSVAGILSLDRIAKLVDYRTEEGNPTSNANYPRSVYPYKQGDMSILYQPTYRTESPLFDEKMPYAGTLLWYGGTLLASRIKNPPTSSSTSATVEDIQRGIGELRWSSMLESSPELFSPYNRYVPVVPSNEIIALESLGDMVYGFSRDRAYNIRKDTGLGMGYMRIMDLHEGFGTTGPNSLQGIGSSMYYMTPKGIKALNTKGQLDDVRAFDHHIVQNWPRDLSNVHMGYDPTGSVLFALHPDQEEALCMWFNTGRATILKDVAFSQVKMGPWPDRVSTYTDDLVDRAMFLQNPPTETGAQGFKPRIYVHDYKYERVIADSGLGSEFNGKTRITMMDGNGDTRFETSADVSSKQMTLSDVDGSKLSNAWIGAYVYVMDSSTSSFIGKKEKIIKITEEDLDQIAEGTSPSSSDGILHLAGTTLDGLPSGSRVAVSPVYMRWIGHNAGIVSDEGVKYGSDQDYHTSRHMDSLSVAFTDVSGPSSTDDKKDNRYRALAFKGSVLTPVDAQYPTDLNNTKIASITTGQSVNAVAFGEDSTDTLQGSYGVKGHSVAPGIEVICPDLDFLLLSAIVMGKVLPTTRTSRPNVGI
jgi:hypothetical protein